MKRLAVLALALITIAALPAHAELYKWKDASGRTQYGDHPPIGMTATPVARTVGSVSSGGATAAGASSYAPKTPVEQEQEFRKRQLERQEKATEQDKLAQETKTREENCRRARSVLASLESGARQARMDDKGERHFLDDAALEREKAEARNAVSQFCK